MAVAAKSAMPAGRDEATSLDLANETFPTVAIDPVAAEILTANAGGAAALGLFPYATFPIALDPAMPAIARLRQIVTASASGKNDSETLLFWSSSRLKRVKCRITRWGGTGSTMLLLRLEEAEALRERQSAPVSKRRSETPRPSAAPVKATPAAGPRALAATLDADTIAKLAHELKTPLTAIAAASEIMRDEQLGEMKNARYRSYAADIHESATHALDVIASLLADRAKPATSAGRLIAIDLNAIVERTVSSVKALAESCGLTLTFETQGSRPHVAANPTALRQILLNLLTNAIKFTPRGGDVRVATGHIEDGRVFLAVRDTGCGMTGSIAAAAGTIAAAEPQPAWAQGSGIGLPLVETLVRDMGAEIEIVSGPEKGTAATILFSDFTRRFK